MIYQAVCLSQGPFYMAVGEEKEDPAQLIDLTSAHVHLLQLLQLFFG